MITLTALNTESCNISLDYLTASEVKLLIEAIKSKGGWYSFRNSVLILMLYRHGLRRSEAASLRWSDVDLREGNIYIRRIKGSRSGRHPLQGDEMRVLRTFTFCVY
ncbi:MAG: tyrosine-type recombinase/integrase [Xenococcaceae cyanobacterium MO_167.B27]|nr:tyrosine-type recombinase/integrase [Xenococcaceae cyanobacterium MO_167.B27]